MKFIYPTNGQELEVAACKLAIRKSFILFREFAQRRFNFLHEPGFGFKCKWECSKMGISSAVHKGYAEWEAIPFMGCFRCLRFVCEKTEGKRDREREKKRKREDGTLFLVLHALI